MFVFPFAFFLAIPHSALLPVVPEGLTHRYSSIPSLCQHDQAAIDHRSDPVLCGETEQDGVIGTGIENDPFRLKGENIINPFLLPFGSEVEGYRIHVSDMGASDDNFQPGNISLAKTQRDHMMSVFYETLHHPV